MRVLQMPQLETGCSTKNGVLFRHSIGHPLPIWRKGWIALIVPTVIAHGRKLVFGAGTITQNTAQVPIAAE